MHFPTVLPHQQRGRTDWSSRGYAVLFAIGALLLMYGPFLIAYIHTSASPFVFGDDARAWVVPFVVSDYALDYHLSLSPIGYKAFYRAASLVADPIKVSKVLTYPLFLGLLAAVSVAAGRLGGVAASFSAAALCLSSGVFLLAMDGTPHAFGFPWMAAAAAGVVFGRRLWLAAIVLISAAVYPSIAVVTGMALALETFFLSKLHNGETREWSLKRRTFLIAAISVGCAAILIPGLTAKGYGARIMATDVAAYPEAGPGGRYDEENRPPYDSFVTEVFKTTQYTLEGAGSPWSYRVHTRFERWTSQIEIIVLAITTIGLGTAALRSSPVRRLLTLGVAAAVAHTAAVLFTPYLYLPSRYVFFPLPILLVIGIPVAAGSLPTLLRQLKRFVWLPQIATLSMTAVCLLLLGGRGSDRTGLSIDLRQHSQLFEFLSRSPNAMLIAGWPSDPIIDSVPYLARRRALVTYETHQAFHQIYLDEMRRRMRALIDAIFATDPAPLVHLRDEWGVTYLIVDRQYYGSSPPTYFKPFDEWVRIAVQRGRETGFEVPRQLESATVFSDGTLVVLNLRKLYRANESPEK